MDIIILREKNFADAGSWHTHTHTVRVAMIISRMIFSQYESNHEYSEIIVSANIFHPTVSVQ